MEQNAKAMVGRVLDGRYRIDALLGFGGMGLVFRGVQTSVNRPIALKTLHPEMAMAPQFFERFKREAETASRLHHPNIITVFDFGRAEDGLVYFVMEYLAGQSLRDRVRTKGPLSLREAVTITSQAAEGVGHAHNQGVVHRDIKPHNIMLAEVDGGQYVKVLDFGLVKAMEQEDDEHLTSTGQVLGTPQYMPPEQAGGEAVDQRSDLYALTGVLFFCLTGRSPFGANSVRKALQAALTQEVPAVATLRQGAPVPEAIDELIRIGLKPEKEDRFQSVEEFLEAMQDALAGQPDEVLDAVPEFNADAGPEKGSGASSASRKGSQASRSTRSVSAVKSRAVSRGGSSRVEVAPSLLQEPPAPAPAGVPRGIIVGAAVALLLIVGGGIAAKVLLTPAPSPVPEDRAPRGHCVSPGRPHRGRRAGHPQGDAALDAGRGRDPRSGHDDRPQPPDAGLAPRRAAHPHLPPGRPPGAREDPQARSRRVPRGLAGARRPSPDPRKDCAPEEEERRHLGLRLAPGLAAVVSGSSATLPV